MSQVLAISSMVANGHVGGALTQFVLQRMGHQTWLLPTVLMSNHPGHAHAASERIAPDLLAKMLDALDDNGWLGGIDAVFTGYLPSREHVAFAVRTIERLRAINKGLLVCCDPILGDEPGGLYIDAAAAAAVRDSLLPLCDLAAPNRFELLWLAGRPGTEAADLDAAARSLGPPTILITSAARSRREISTQLVTPGNRKTLNNKLLTNAPHGTGDAMAALFCGHYLNSKDAPGAAQFAARAISVILEASQDSDHPDLISTQDRWMQGTK